MNAEHHAGVLRSLSAQCSEKESELLEKAAQFIELQQRAVEGYERIRAAIRHARPESTGAYLICGGSPVDERLGVPERVEICPAFGSDVVYVYARTDRSIIPEW